MLPGSRPEAGAARRYDAAMSDDPRAFYDALADDYHLIFADWEASQRRQTDVLAAVIASELGPEVRVNGVSPGIIIWPEDERWADELARQRLVQTTLLKRVGDPDDIARTVRFLVFDAPYITGQVIAVDGGRSITL